MMRLKYILHSITMIAFGIVSLAHGQAQQYPWLTAADTNITRRIAHVPVPDGFKRTDADSASFGFWLRHLPLLPDGNRVHLYNGSLKKNQSAHFAIINIDVGTRDLQQCADAVIRLYAEYLYVRHRYQQLAFHFTSGDVAQYNKWLSGYRPQVNGNTVKWLRSSPVENTHDVFRQYLNVVFTYAGSYSLSQAMQPIAPSDVQIGDVFIQGGFPGHAIIVVDAARHPETNEIALLLAQSYMPAQQIHVLQNNHKPGSTPWFMLFDANKLYTPEWTFDWNDLKRFKSNSN